MKQDTVRLQSECVPRSRRQAGNQEQQVGETWIERRLHCRTDLEAADPAEAFFQEHLEVTGIHHFLGPFIMTLNTMHVAVIVRIEKDSIKILRLLAQPFFIFLTSSWILLPMFCCP